MVCLFGHSHEAGDLCEVFLEVSSKGLHGVSERERERERLGLHLLSFLAIAVIMLRPLPIQTKQRLGRSVSS